MENWIYSLKNIFVCKYFILGRFGFCIVLIFRSLLLLGKFKTCFGLSVTCFFKNTPGFYIKTPPVFSSKGEGVFTKRWRWFFKNSSSFG